MSEQPPAERNAQRQPQDPLIADLLEHYAREEVIKFAGSASSSEALAKLGGAIFKLYHRSGVHDPIGHIMRGYHAEQDSLSKQKPDPAKPYRNE